MSERLVNASSNLSNILSKIVIKAEYNMIIISSQNVSNEVVTIYETAVKK